MLQLQSAPYCPLGQPDVVLAAVVLTAAVLVATPAVVVVTASVVEA